MSHKISILLTIAILVSSAACAEEPVSAPKATPLATEKALPAKAKDPAPVAKTPPAKQPLAVTAKTPDSQQLVFQKHKNDCNQKVIDEKLDSFEKRADDFKWTIRTVLMIIGGVVGLLMWKYDRQYREAKNDLEKTIRETKELVKEAEKIRDNVKICEQDVLAVLKGVGEELKGKMVSFDRTFDEKLELEEKTKKHVKEILAQAETQLELSRKWDEARNAVQEKDFDRADALWDEITEEELNAYWAFTSWGNAFLNRAKSGGPDVDKHFDLACKKYEKATALRRDKYEASYNLGNAYLAWGKLGGPDAEERFRLACEKYAKAKELNPNKDKIFNNWGIVLKKWADLGGPEAKTRYELACEKYKQATSLNSDYYKAFNYWGGALLCWAKLDVAKKENLLEEAIEKLEAAEKIQKGSAAYNIACVWARRQKEGKCKEWLKFGEKKGTLETREHAMADEDLASMREEDWFKQIKWKGEK